MRAKKNLKYHGSRIYISEQLTYTASKCFYEARTLVREKKIASVWTNERTGFLQANHFRYQEAEPYDLWIKYLTVDIYQLTNIWDMSVVIFHFKYVLILMFVLIPLFVFFLGMVYAKINSYTLFF